MWLFHAQVQPKVINSFTDTISLQNKKIASASSIFPSSNFKGNYTAKWREYSKEQQEGHNLYPCIDIIPDASTLHEMQLALLHSLQECELIDCTYRITDYGYLHMIVCFKLQSVEALSSLYAMQTGITRTLNSHIETIFPLIDVLHNLGYVTMQDSFFGIPNTIKDFVHIDSTDMYTYQDVTIVVGSSSRDINQIKDLYAIHDTAETIERFTVNGIDQSPIIYTHNKVSIPEIHDIIEPYSVLLAEINTYDAISNLNFAIIQLMNDAENLKQSKKRSTYDTKLYQAYRSFSSSDLRKITIHSHYILHCINYRKTAILPWQNTLIRKFKEKNPYTENKENFDTSESIIVKLIEEKTQEMQKGHSHVLEVLFGFLSIITVYSTYVDIATFLDSEHSNFANVHTGSLEIKIFISITILLGIIVLYIIRLKSRK